MPGLCVGIDIGGTNLKAGLLTPDGRMLDTCKHQLTPEEKSEAGAVSAMKHIFSELLGRSGLGPDGLLGVGLGVAGIIDDKLGVITQAPQFPLWRNFALVERLSKAIGLPVAMENDVNAIARGEKWCGAAVDVDNFICMAIGTGLGGALCLNGEIWSGMDGMAGEFGHICVDAGGAPCGCGSNGCLETFASAVGLIRMVKADNYRTVLDHAADDAAIPYTLARLAESGDAQAKRYWEIFGRALGQVLGGLLNALNVKTVLFGGGLSKSFSLFAPAMEAEIKHRAFPAVARNLDFRVGKLWEDAGIYGAAAALLNRIDRRERTW
ncbi:MAG: ROK family protein [Myxococcales bacterium]|nr:MAG: ROK family protein [Myxococcales bacterium]